MAGASPMVLGALCVTGSADVADAQAVNLGGPTVNNIVPDGRTRTKVSISGQTTKITTDTVSSGVGFNTFSDFEQASGTRVDLYVPDQAGSLVNIVKNGIVIDGTLNAYKNGQIGGNVFFSSSKGFVLGSNGVINVGSLTVNTPTDEFLDRVVRADGTVNNSVADQLMRGEIPVSHDGLISISGQVNAEGSITLQGHTVQINHETGPITADDLGQRTKFNATVNATGLQEGTALVSHGGQISLIAEAGVSVAGRIDASGTPTSENGGGIDILSAGDIDIFETAQLFADAAGPGGDGGRIFVFADEALRARDGSTYSARGLGEGAGGFLDLSGTFARIGAVSVDLSTDSGVAGTFVIDPFNLVVGATSTTGADDDFSLSAVNSIFSLGADVLFQADNSITLVNGAVIDSTNGGGVAGSITLESRLITLEDGSTINAGTGANAGDVTLTAVGNSGQSAAIQIGQGTGTQPIVSGKTLTFSASSTSDGIALLASTPTANATLSFNSATLTAEQGMFATATATVDRGLTYLPIGVVVTNADALVEVTGATTIDAASMDIDATTTVVSIIETQSIAPENSSVDGAVAVSTINSSAVTRIDGNAVVNTSGALDLDAVNSITSEANATPMAAPFGASVGVSIIDAETTAEIAGAADVEAGSLTLNAQTTTGVTVNAAAAAGGATDPSPGTQAATFLADAKYGGQATDSGGNQVSVVGALAISDLTSATRAAITSTNETDVTGAVSVTSQSENTAAVTADGSAVESDIGVGVALGINLAQVKNDALVARDVSAGSVTLSATTPMGNSFTTSATSGAGAADVGISGSFALNLIDTQATARMDDAAALVLSGGSFSATAKNETVSKADALPTGGGATGDTVGVGGSIALNILANRSTAEIADEAVLSGAGDITLRAKGTFSTETKAEAGSAGGISLTPVVALSLVNNTTTARLGELTGTQTAAGDVTVAAAQTSSTVTTASGKSAGSKAAVGAALALALVDDQVLANTERNVTAAAGAVTFEALGASSSVAEATASASGGTPAEEDGSAQAGEEPDVDSKVSSQLSSGSSKQKSAGVGDANQQSATDDAVADDDSRSASTSEGKVSVAAAVGINVQNATVTAGTVSPNVDGGVPTTNDVNVVADGGLTVRTAANTTGEVTSSGAAVGEEDDAGNTPEPSAVGIGAGVSVNVVKAKNKAVLGTGVHTLGGATIEALSLDVAQRIADDMSTDTASDSYKASATSGAGAGKVGIAGSVAINLVDTESNAVMASGANVSITGGGTFSLASDNQTNALAEALPTGGGASGETVGVGASVALNILANRSIAEIADDAVLSGAGDITLRATGAFSTETKAEAGSAGGVSITPVVALSLVNNTTSARIGSLMAGLDSSGAISVSATQNASVTTTASGEAAGGKAAIGAALALALIDDQVLATTARDLTTTSGSVSFAASGVSSSTLEATASATGAAEGDDEDAAPDSDGESVDKSTNAQLTAGADKQQNAGVGDSSQRGSTQSQVNDQDKKDARSAKTSEGKVSVAAAVSVNVHDATVTAAVPDGVNITSAGALNIDTTNNTNASATSDGSAVAGEGEASQVGIGVAVSVNVVNETNSATLGQGAHSAEGVNITAKQGAGDPTDTFLAKATSGAGGSKVGIAGSLALNTISVETTAQVSSAATVDVKTGASVIEAEEKLQATAEAAPSDEGATGGKVGVGASVGLNLINTKTTAQLQDGATVTNGVGLNVSATSDVSTETNASAGAAGGIAVDASVALALLDIQTSARIGTGTGLSTGAGAVSVTATGTGGHTATSTGENKSGKVGVGASAAVILGAGDSDGALENTSVTSASVARDITAGSLSVSASAERTYDATATATSGGGEFSEGSDEKKNETTGGSSTTADSLDKTKDSQRSSDGSKGGSKVTVAAAAGIAAAQDRVEASVGDVTIDLVGALSVTADNDVGMATEGNGQAVNSTSNVSVGIGVGLGILNNTTSASIADGATVTNANGVTVAAESLENANAGYVDKLTALGVAGSSGKKVSVAGAVGVGISTGQTSARIGDNVSVTNGGAISVTADNTSHLAAKAAAGALSGGGTGIGASIAVVVSEKSYAATVGTGVDITGSSLLVRARNIKIDGSTTFNFTDLDDLKATLTSGQLLGSNNYYVEAIGGAAGSKASIQGSFGVMVFSDELTASVGNSASGATSVQSAVDAGGGSVSIEANNDFLAKALSGAISASGGSGAGIASSVIVSDSTTKAELAANSDITNATSFAAKALASQDIQAYGVSVAAASNNAVSGVATVITSQNSVQALLGRNASATLNGAGAADVIAQNTFSTYSVAGGAAGGGSNGVGASGSVVVVENVTRAALADGTSVTDRAELNTDGDVEVSATASETGTSIAAAGAAAGTAAIGAGAGVYVLDTTTEALIGDFAQVGNTYTAGNLDVSASDVSELFSVGGTASFGGNVGAGAGVAIGVIDKATTASVGQSATIQSGNIVVSANSEEYLSAVTVGAAVGGSAGLAGAVAVYSVSATTAADVGNNATLHANGNVAVLANNDTQIDMLDGAIAAGGVGIGASVGVTVINATTHATVNDNAQITALGNGSAQDYVAGFTPVFGAQGSDDFEAANIDSNKVRDATAGASADTLRDAEDARQAGLSLLTDKRTKIPDTQQAKGVIVNARGASAVRSMAVAGAAAGNVAVSLSASVPVVTMTTTATVGNGVQVNKLAGGTASTEQGLTVAAANDTYSLGFSGAVALAGSVAGGAGVNAAVVELTTTARVGSADVVANGDVRVSAHATEDFAIWAVAGAGSGTAALAGSGSAVDLTTNTTATLGGTVLAQGNVDVLADDTTRTSMLSGSVAVGLTGGGIGAAVGVILLDKTVTASIAASADVTAYGQRGTRDTYPGAGFDTTRLASGVNVAANSAQSAFSIVVSGAGGLYVGVSGVIALDLMDVTTSALIGANAQINTAGNNDTQGSATQDVVVSARDTTVTAVGAGAVAVGLAGLSGAVDVGVFKTTTAGFIDDGVTLNARRNVAVSGLSNKDSESLVASGSGGGFALAAGIAVYSYGDGIAPNGDADKELSDSSDGAADMDGINADASDQARNDDVDTLLQSSDDDRVRQISSDAQSKRNSIDVAGAAQALTVPAGTSASVGNASISAGGALDVTSSDDIRIDLKTGAFALGAAAVGAGVAVVTVDTSSTAQINAASRTLTAASVGVSATTDHNIIARTFAGSAGLSVALSADVAVIKNRSNTKAFIDAQRLSTRGAVAVNADARRVIDIVGLGVSIAGTAGVGASVATAEMGGAVNAYIQDTEIEDDFLATPGDTRAGSVDVAASSSDTVTADATAAGGGIGFALQGAASVAQVETTVSAAIDNADIDVANAVDVTAEATMSGDSTATGFAVAGLAAAGGSLAETSVNADVTARIGDGSDITAGSVLVETDVETPLAQSRASGSAGALVGLTATNAESHNRSSSIASIEDSQLQVSGLVKVDAGMATTQHADASGLAVGIVAAGFNDSEATSDTATHATVSDVSSLQAGSLTISAEGIDTNTVETVAGSGGLVAGSAASGTTTSTSDTKAVLANSTGSTRTVRVSGDTNIAASHTSGFEGHVDSTQASLVGGSGASLHHTVSSNVDANVGDRFDMETGSLFIDATNKTENNFLSGSRWNVNSASGGLANLPAGGATISVTHGTTNASIGDNSIVSLVRSGGLSDLRMSAFSDITSEQKVKIDSGGAIALANAEIESVFRANTTSGIGDNSAVVVDRGSVEIAAWGEADIEMRAAATTYGLAGAPSGDANITYTGANDVSFGRNALLQVTDGINPTNGDLPTEGTITIAAGRDLNDDDPDLKFDAILDLFNKTAIPISGAPDPTVTVSSTGRVTIDATTPDSPTEGIRAAGDITISASRGDISATADGTGKDIYREALAAVASAISNAFGGGDVTFDYNGGSTSTSGGIAEILLDGTVQTGIQRFKTLTLNYVTTACDANASACLADDPNANITFRDPVQEEVGTEILERRDELDELISAYDVDPIAKAAYQSEKTYLERKLVDLGLGTFVNGVYTPNATSGTSTAALDAQVASVNSDISRVNNDFDEAVSLDLGDLLRAADSADASYTDTDFGLNQSKSSALNDATKGITTMSAYSTIGQQKIYFDAAEAARAAGESAALLIRSARSDTVTRQSTIEAEATKITQQESLLADAIASGDTTAEANARTAILSSKAKIETNLTEIATNNTTIDQQTAIAEAKAVELDSNMQSLVDQAVADALANRTTAQANLTAVNNDSDSTNAEKTAALNAFNTADGNYQADLGKRTALNSTSSTPADNGFLARISETASQLTNIDTTVDTGISTANSEISVLNSGITDPAGVDTANKSLDQFVSVLNNLSSSLASAKQAQAAGGSPTTAFAFTIEVDDTSARLGNLSFNSDVLRSTAASESASTGYALAPGNAKIEITNNTSNTLKLNNLLMPDYDAGNVRLNGVLVYSNADIEQLNGGIAANLKQIETGRNSDRPEVTITSNYNSESIQFYNPGSSLPQENTRRIAPDIILNTDAVIDNVGGPVVIQSESGNIYIRGRIEAGSVDILAKNGDFVSSFVNGFNHIGGDPSAFTTGDNSGYAGGAGITANGAVSIAARFLNINSTIQSGIAEWTLDLDSAQELTISASDAAMIGLDQANIDNLIANNPNANSITVQSGVKLVRGSEPFTDEEREALAEIVAQYNEEVLKNPDASPLRVISIGGESRQVNIRDYLSSDIDTRLVFTKDYANGYAAGASGDQIYTVETSPSSNIGASYDADNRQYLVDGASVKGGYVQLFGQIMNTTVPVNSNGEYVSGGRINVLDGFGTIDITNTSDIPVVLSNLSAGEDPDGNLRGVEGRIELTDVIGVDVTTPAEPVVSVRQTIYTRDYTPGDASGIVRVETRTGTIDNLTGDLILPVNAVNTTGGDRTASYQPELYQRYVWTTGQAFEQSIVFTETSTRLFGADFLEVANVQNLNRPSTINGAPNPNPSPIFDVIDGKYVTGPGYASPNDVTQTGNDSLLYTSNGVIVVENPRTKSNSDATVRDDRYISSTFSYVDESKNDLSTTSRTTSCNWWTLCIVSDTTYQYTLTQEYTTVTTNSLKADYPIAINFIGENTGGISVNSASDVVLAGNITNFSGNTTINATGTTNNGDKSSIVQASQDTLLRSQSVDLSAAGYVGGRALATDPAGTDGLALRIDLNNADSSLGYIAANAADGNVDILSRNDILVDQITAAGATTLDPTTSKGRVNLVSFGEILNRTSGTGFGTPLVQGSQVSLTALGGAIGGTDTADMLKVNTAYTSDPTERPFGDPDELGVQANALFGLTALAAGDIGIYSEGWSDNTDGTMLVDQVQSLGGDVRLDSTGQILDNNPSEIIDTRTYNELLGFWDDLGLIAPVVARTATDPDTGRTFTVDAINTGNNAIKNDLTVTGYENVRTKEYNQYWAIRQTQDDPSTYDPTFEVTVDPNSAQYDTLSSFYEQQIVDESVAADLSQYEASNNVTLDPASDLYDQLVTQFTNDAQSDPTLGAQVQTKIGEYEADQTEQYRNLHETVGAETDNAYLANVVPTYEYKATADEIAEARSEIELSNPDKTTTEIDALLDARVADIEATRTQDIRNTADPDSLANTFLGNYAYTASDAEKTERTAGSLWTERELAFAISPGALKTVTGTNPVIKDPNVSGRSVTLNAKVGIGETKVDPNTNLVGTSIRSSLDPSLLTLDQKVALAAAERSDLILTVEDFSFGGVTQDVVIPLGDQFDTLTAVQQAAYDAAATGQVSADKTVLTILSKRPLNFEASTDLNVTVTDAQTSAPTSDTGKAYLASLGDARLGNITTDGETRIKVRGDIQNVGGTIQTGNIVLEAAQGAIGLKTDLPPQDVPLVLNLNAGATTTARAQNGINISFVGDGVIDTVYSPNDVSLTANGALTNANQDELINILGTQVDLVAVAGPIGEETNPLNVGVNLGGGINAVSGGDIYLFGPAANVFTIQSALADGDIGLDASGESTIDGQVRANGAVKIRAGGRQVITENGTVSSLGGDTEIDAARLRMLDGSSVTAKGKISVETEEEALVSALSSDSAGADAVEIIAGGGLYGSNSDRAFDVRTTQVGAGVILSAGIGIGDKTVESDNADGETTDIANPVRLDTDLLEATAMDGDIVLSALSDVTIGALSAPLGGIDVTGAGAMTVLTAESGGDQRFETADALNFGRLETTGLPTALGDITLISQTGDVRGDDVSSAGSTTVTGQAIGVDGVDAGLDALLTALVGDVQVETISAGGIAQVGAIAGIGFGEITSGTDTDLSTQTGTVAGRSVLAGGAVALEGQEVDVDTVVAARSSSLIARAGDVAVRLVTAGAASSIVANDNVRFEQVTAATNSLISARTGSVDGNRIEAGANSTVVGQTVTLSSIETGSSSGITAQSGNVTVDQVTTGANSSITAQGAVRFQGITTAGDSTINARTGAVTGGDVTTGGSSTILGNGVVFNTISAGANSTIVSQGDIIGRSEIAVGDVVNIAGSTGRPADLLIDIIRGRNLTLQATGKLDLGDLEVRDGIDLKGGEISANITQVPASDVPLSLVIGAPFGRLATRADISINAQAVEVTELRAVDANIDTTASRFDILDAFVSGELLLTTPDQTVLVDNRSSQPRTGNNIQAFSPTFEFNLSLDGIENETNAFVVNFDETIDTTDVLSLLPFEGISLQRDSARRLMQTDGMLAPDAFEILGSNILSEGLEDDDEDLEDIDFNDVVLEIDGIEYQVLIAGNGPAVLLRQ